MIYLNKKYPIASCVAILSADNLLYVANRRNKPNELCFPGGKLDPNENIITNVCRETWEETGMKLNECNIIPVYSGFCWPKDKDEEPYWCVGFVVKLEMDAKHVEKTKGIENGIEGRWVSFEEFAQKSAFPQYDENIIKAVKMLYDC